MRASPAVAKRLPAHLGPYSQRHGLAKALYFILYTLYSQPRGLAKACPPFVLYTLYFILAAPRPREGLPSLHTLHCILYTRSPTASRRLALPSCPQAWPRMSRFIIYTLYFIPAGLAEDVPPPPPPSAHTAEISAAEPPAAVPIPCPVPIAAVLGEALLPPDDELPPPLAAHEPHPPSAESAALGATGGQAARQGGASRATGRLKEHLLQLKECLEEGLITDDDFERAIRGAQHDAHTSYAYKEMNHARSPRMPPTPTSPTPKVHFRLHIPPLKV